jgi:mannose-6-phosphate isomerase-like protein (cupin superfamily)
MSSTSSGAIAPGERLRIGSDELTVRVTGAATRGALLAIEVEIPVGGGPPALHRHAPEEIYRVERGALAIYVEREGGGVQRTLATPGDVVHIPAGLAHTVRNESGAEARAYVIFAPAAEMEGFLRAAGALAANGPPRSEELMALAGRHGIEMTGALPAAEPPAAHA